MNDDVRAERMIANGEAIDAKKWLIEKIDDRRIGESPTPERKSPLARLVEGTSIVNEWVVDIRRDDRGKEFASQVIYELPQRGRKGVFTGLSLRHALAGMSPIEDTGQKYVICTLPSAKQVEMAKNKIKNDGKC